MKEVLSKGRSLAIGIIACTACVLSIAAHAQSLSDPAILKKVADPEMITAARNGIAQTLIVDINSEDLEQQAASERQAIDQNLELTRRAMSPNANDSDAASAVHAAKQQKLASLQRLRAALAKRKHDIVDPLAQHGVRMVRDFTSSGGFVVTVQSEASLAALLAHPAVVRVHLDKKIEPAAAWPTNRSDITLIGVNRLPSPSTAGKGVRVGLIDTGFDAALIPGFDGKPGACINSNGGFQVGGNCRLWDPLNTTNGLPCWKQSMCPNGDWEHATVDLQIVAYTAPGAYLDNIQVIDNNGNGTEQDVLDALDWYVAAKAEETPGDGTPPLVAVNMSIAMRPDQKFTAACADSSAAKSLQQLISMGVVPVVASGNRAWTDGVNSPACVPGVLAVGAVTDSAANFTHPGTKCQVVASKADVVACFANRSPSLLSVYAPGVLIGDPNTTGAMAGTSQAAPHVAAEVAILRAIPAGAKMTVTQIKSTITSNGPLITDTAGTNKRRIDVAQAAASLTVTVASLSASPTSVTVNPGRTSQLTATAYDAKGAVVTDPPLTWSVDDSTIATVDSDGVVHGVKNGVTTARVQSGSASDSTAVTVATRVSGGPTDPCKINPKSCTRTSR